MAKWISRTTKGQFEATLNFLEHNKDIVYYNKSQPLQDTVNKKKWETLAEPLNSSGLGPVKTVEQWRKVFTELKTNTKRHFRQLKKEQAATGGGEMKVKVLSDIEERVLALISRVSLEGSSEVEDTGVTRENTHNNTIEIKLMEEYITEMPLGGEEGAAIISKEEQPVPIIKKKKPRKVKGRNSALQQCLNKYEHVLQAQIKMQEDMIVSNVILAEAISTMSSAIFELAKSVKKKKCQCSEKK